MSPSKQTEVMMSIRSQLLTALVMALALQSTAGCSLFGRRLEARGPQSVSYISLNLESSKYLSMLKTIENKLGHKLKSRGEAHITVITPPEYKKLRQKLSHEHLEELTELFIKSNPQYTLKCIGFARKNAKEVYYVVVESAELKQFRRQLSEKAKLPTQVFDPELFFPHITLGFSSEDLHYEDGVIKNAATCLDDFQDVMTSSI